MRFSPNVISGIVLRSDTREIRFANNVILLIDLVDIIDMIEYSRIDYIELNTDCFTLALINEPNITLKVNQEARDVVLECIRFNRDNIIDSLI